MNEFSPQLHSDIYDITADVKVRGIFNFIFLDLDLFVP